MKTASLAKGDCLIEQDRLANTAFALDDEYRWIGRREAKKSSDPVELATAAQQRYWLHAYILIPNRRHGEMCCVGRPALPTLTTVTPEYEHASAPPASDVLKD